MVSIWTDEKGEMPLDILTPSYQKRRKEKLENPQEDGVLTMSLKDATKMLAGQTRSKVKEIIENGSRTDSRASRR